MNAQPNGHPARKLSNGISIEFDPDESHLSERDINFPLFSNGVSDDRRRGDRVIQIKRNAQRTDVQLDENIVNNSNHNNYNNNISNNENIGTHNNQPRKYASNSLRIKTMTARPSPIILNRDNSATLDNSGQRKYYKPPPWLAGWVENNMDNSLAQTPSPSLRRSSSTSGIGAERKQPNQSDTTRRVQPPYITRPPIFQGGPLQTPGKCIFPFPPLMQCLNGESICISC